jgi:hypothetical protein
MGADGGIEWVYVRDWNVFNSLVAHLRFDDDDRDDHCVARRELPDNVFVCTYSNIYDALRLSELFELMDEWTDTTPSDPRFEPLPVADVGDLRWRDVPLDWLTTPTYQISYLANTSVLAESVCSGTWLFKHWLQAVEDDELDALSRVLEQLSTDDYPHLDTTLREWSHLFQQIVFGDVQRLETWT